jgi:hypothetical protein
MNPLLWPREHQLALCVAGALGFVVAFLLCFLSIHPLEHWTVEYVKGNGALGWLTISRRWVLGPLAGLFGAGVASTVVYIQLLVRHGAER